MIASAKEAAEWIFAMEGEPTQLDWQRFFAWLKASLQYVHYILFLSAVSHELKRFNRSEDVRELIGESGNVFDWPDSALHALGQPRVTRLIVGDA